MAISDHIDADEQEISMLAKYGSNFFSNDILSIEHESAYDQLVGTCTIRLAVPPTFVVTSDLIHQVKVYEGYFGDNVATFTGYVADFKKSRFPNTWEVICEDVLRKAKETFLDDEGQEFSSTQAEDAIETLLGLAGLSVSTEATSFTIGDVNPVKFKVVSVLEACKQIADLIGWRLWAGPDGTVYFRYQRPLPAASGVWDYPKNKILEYVHTQTDRNLRNRIVVVGYDTIRSVAYGASPYVPSPPQYRTAIYSTELIDTQDMADTIAGRMFAELNHLQRSMEMKVVANPLVNVGNTISVSDSENGISGKWFVFRRKSTNTGTTEGYTMNFTVLAKDDADSEPNYEPPPPDDGGEDPPPDPGIPPETGDGSRMYMATDVGMVYTDNFLDAAPTWVAINDGLSGTALNVLNFLFDPYSSDGTHLTAAYIITEDGIYKNTALPDGTWTQVLDASTLEGLIGANTDQAISQFSREMVCPINTEDYVGFVARKSVIGDFAGHHPQIKIWVYSTDGGSTWNAAMDYWRKSNGAPLLPTVSDNFAFASNKYAGRIYLSTINYTDWDGTAGGDTPRLYQSDDGGVTWEHKVLFGYIGRAYYLHFPYADGLGGVYGSDNRCWHSYYGGIGRTSDFPNPVYPDNWENVDIGIEGVSTRFMDCCTWNENFIYALVDTPGNGVLCTNDGGETWSLATPATGGEGNLFYCLSALPSNPQFCVVANSIALSAGRAYITVDGGATWDNQTGDLNTALPGIIHVSRIVPDWIWVGE